ncbi:ADP-heptose--LPS heptosyltransferase RfaF [Muriicola jejuensis]|uniref:ADP-heptose--LPS heptosyltransferase RfaF n=2 Tax=Muriicola jejuensis TaxID=504488 RepID=A0A6P0UI81_9FLAO|nr:ADP-heptose--LPS heptosyltransferase RfaF [Muriicola jejuensis]
MGDVAMTVPVLLSLLRLNPQLKLRILTRPFFTPIFKDIPNIEVIAADLKNKHRGIPGIYRLAKTLKKDSISGIADLHNVLRTKILRLFFFGTGLPFIQLNKGRKEKRNLTRWKEKDISPLKSTHERYADVFRKMGYSVELKPVDTLARRSASKAAEEYAFKESKKLIGIAPFAAFQGKMYPLDLMEQVLEYLNNTNKYKILLFGGGSEEIAHLEEFESHFEHCSSPAGRLSFEQELELISHLDLMVSMDSGNGHLAAMFGIPTLTLWGITHPYAGFTPYGQPMENSIMADRGKYPMIPTSVYGNKYPKGYEQVMQTIEPEIVINRITALMGE